MSIVDFWPCEQFITQCIRTEAEELPEHVLLAVHEPMNLRRVGINTEEVKNEYDLLTDFLSTERPIPIVGRSGVGKSHLIRWIDAQLKLKPECKDWHIVRIPKNASLRQVLELLLRDLEGELFDKARQNISTVGEKLSVKNVAELLLTFMSQQLVKLRETTQVRMREIANNPDSKKNLLPQDIEYFKKIKAHTVENQGLSELITDPHFRESLLQEKHCIYKFAQRFTLGTSDLDADDSDYKLHAEDLAFNYQNDEGKQINFQIDDLSLGARNYVKNVRINTESAERQKAVDLLNEVLSEANKALFGQLFSFSSGSFIDLFKDIRRLLNKKNKTLVILVEDMAAISAIEDVLIDSLLEESITDGKQELCILRSAIAVTDGYSGYSRRRETIKTRAQYEWHISEHVEEENILNQRIIEFVARYLNAARFGSRVLYTKWQDNHQQSWPPIWANVEVDEIINAFGYSEKLKIPLFPFNQNAILALANKYCTESSHLKFNPRQILNQIILRVLRNKHRFEQNDFPSMNFADIPLSPNVSSHLARFKNSSRCISIAALWGYDSRSIENLAIQLDYRIAQAFGMDDFAKTLRDFESQGSSIVKTTALVKEVPLNTRLVKQVDIIGTVTDKDPLQVEFEAIDRVIEKWLQPQGGILLDQDTAKILRQELEQMFMTFLQRDRYSFNLSANVAKKIKVSNRVYIFIPNAQGNYTDLNILSFFKTADLLDQKKLIEIQSICFALLRNVAAKQKGFAPWAYPEGYRDYLIYQNFAMHWVPSSMQAFIREMHYQATDAIKAQIETAYRLGVWKGAETIQQKLDHLLLSQDQLTYFAKMPLISGLQEPLKKWDIQQKAWLDLFAQNEHIYEGKQALDIFKTAERQVLANGVLSVLGVQITRELREIRPKIDRFEFTTREGYSNALKLMIENIGQVSQHGQYYPQQSNILPTANDFIAQIESIDSAECWQMIKGLGQLIQDVFAEQGANWEKIVINVQRINITDLEKLTIVLRNWDEFYRKSYFEIKQVNDSNGANTLEQARNKIDHLLINLDQTLQGLNL